MKYTLLSIYENLGYLILYYCYKYYKYSTSRASSGVKEEFSIYFTLYFLTNSMRASSTENLFYCIV